MAQQAMMSSVYSTISPNGFVMIAGSKRQKTSAPHYCKHRESNLAKTIWVHRQLDKN